VGDRERPLVTGANGTLMARQSSKLGVDPLPLRNTMATERNEELIIGDLVVPERPGGRSATAQ
jgi:hypothetical protein